MTNIARVRAANATYEQVKQQIAAVPTTRRERRLIAQHVARLLVENIDRDFPKESK